MILNKITLMQHINLTNSKIFTILNLSKTFKINQITLPSLKTHNNSNNKLNQLLIILSLFINILLLNLNLKTNKYINIQSLLIIITINSNRFHNKINKFLSTPLNKIILIYYQTTILLLRMVILILI